MCSRWPGVSEIASRFAPPMSLSSCGCPVRAATATGRSLAGSTGHLRRASSTDWAMPSSAGAGAPPRRVPASCVPRFGGDVRAPAQLPIGLKQVDGLHVGDLWDRERDLLREAVL